MPRAAWVARLTRTPSQTAVLRKDVIGVRVSRGGCAVRQVAVLNPGDGSQGTGTADSPAGPAVPRISVLWRQASKQCHAQGHARRVVIRVVRRAILSGRLVCFLTVINVKRYYLAG